MSTTNICTNAAVQRLARRLQLPDNTTEVVLRLKAGELATMTITRLLTPQEAEEIGAWYGVENLQRQPQETTTSTLEPAGLPPLAPARTMVDPLEEQQRQELIEQLYHCAGRDNPEHPQHATYTGLYQEWMAQQAEQNAG